MNNFWDNLNRNSISSNNNFNIQKFLQFAQQMKGQDPNQVLQQMLNSGQITQEQIENAKSQANNIYQMLKNIGILK